MRVTKGSRTPRPALFRKGRGNTRALPIVPKGIIFVESGSIMASLAFVFCFFVSVAFAQQAKKPLSLEDIEQLLKIGVSSRGAARVIDDHGVNFEVTEDVKERLRKAGADSTVIQAVEKAALEFARKRNEKEEPGAGVDVAKVQRLLKALGYEPGPADGIAGARTRDAIRSFQHAAGLRPDGEISDEVVRRLGLEHERRKLEEEQRKVEEEGRRLKEERHRVEREKRRAQDRRRKPAAPSPGVLSSSPTPPGYMDVTVSKIASDAFVNELKNKKVKVLVSSLIPYRLLWKGRAPKIADKFVSFMSHGLQGFSVFMVLVPKRMFDKTLSLGQGAALYGQLLQLGSMYSELVLMVDRIEPL